MISEKQSLKDYLLITVVQSQDVERAEDALKGLYTSLERLPSVGGFLGRRNATLLIVFKKIINGLAALWLLMVAALPGTGSTKSTLMIK